MECNNGILNEMLHSKIVVWAPISLDSDFALIIKRIKLCKARLNGFLSKKGTDI